MGVSTDRPLIASVRDNPRATRYTVAGAVGDERPEGAMARGQMGHRSGSRNVGAVAAIALAMALVAASLARQVAARWARWQDLPLRPVTRTGVPDVPINVALVGSPRAVRTAFARAGWVAADPLTPGSALRLALAALLRRRYPAAPVSPLYLDGRLPDLAVEREGASIAVRDHARLWQTGRTWGWTGQGLWLASVSHDSRVEVLRRHGAPVGPTHHVSPDLDAARGRLVASLRATGEVARVGMRWGVGPRLAGQDASGDRFATDGRMALIRFRGR